MNKYIPDQCDCGGFLDRGGYCPKCGDERCMECGRMFSEDECEYCAEDKTGSEGLNGR